MDRSIQPGQRRAESSRSAWFVVKIIPHARRPEPIHEIQDPRQTYRPSVVRGDAVRIPRHCRRRRVGLVLVIVAERGLLLLAIGEVERAVNVLEDDHGLGGCRDKEVAKMGVGGDSGDLEVVDVKLEEVGDGSY